MGKEKSDAKQHDNKRNAKQIPGGRGHSPHCPERDRADTFGIARRIDNKIGKGGAEIEKVKVELQKFTDKKLVVDIKEVKRPDKDAQLVAENIALQLENRVSFRRAMKSCMGRTMKSGAKGIKTSCSGRLGGADMARTEFYSEGTIPLQTLRADIDYGFAEADTTYGKVGVKVWIYKGEVLPTRANKEGGVQ